MKINDLTFFNVSELPEGRKLRKLENNEFQSVSKQIYDINQEPIRTSQLPNYMRARVRVSTQRRAKILK